MAITGSTGQDQHEGPARPRCCPRPGRPWRPRARSTRGRRAAHRLRVDPETRYLVLEMGARGIGHIAYLVRHRPAASRRRAQRRHRARRRVRLARGDRPGQVRARRGAAPRGAGRAQRRRPARRGDGGAYARPGRARRRGRRTPTCAPSTSRSTTTAGRRSPGAHPAGQRPTCTLRLVGRTTSATPSPSSPSPPSSACRSSRSAPHWSPRDRSAAGGWRSSSAPTASPWSTTPTTPTPTRCAPPSARSSGWAEGRRTWAVLGTMLELGDESDALHAEVGAEVVAHGVDELVVVGQAAAALAAGARDAGPASGATGTHVREVPDADARAGAARRRARRRATWCCSSRAATPGYGCSVTDWPDRGRS